MAAVPKLGLAKIGITPNVANQRKAPSRSAGGSAPRSAPRSAPQPKPASNRCETTPAAPSVPSAPTSTVCFVNHRLVESVDEYMARCTTGCSSPDQRRRAPSSLALDLALALAPLAAFRPAQPRRRRRHPVPVRTSRAGRGQRRQRRPAVLPPARSQRGSRSGMP